MCSRSLEVQKMQEVRRAINEMLRIPGSVADAEGKKGNQGGASRVPEGAAD